MPDSRPTSDRPDAVIEHLDAAREAYRELRYRGPTPSFDSVRRPAWGTRWAPAAAGLLAASLAVVVSWVALRDTMQPVPTTRPTTTARTPAAPSALVDPVDPQGSVESTEDVPVEGRPTQPAPEPVEPSPPTVEVGPDVDRPRVDPATDPPSAATPDSPSFSSRWRGPSASAGLGSIHRRLPNLAPPHRPVALSLRVPVRPRRDATDGNDATDDDASR